DGFQSRADRYGLGLLQRERKAHQHHGQEVGGVGEVAAWRMAGRQRLDRNRGSLLHRSVSAAERSASRKSRGPLLEGFPHGSGGRKRYRRTSPANPNGDIGAAFSSA